MWEMLSTIALILVILGVLITSLFIAHERINHGQLTGTEDEYGEEK